MRLKFYLIGLGIGIIVTAVVMGLALRGRTREMTDEEIVARAKQLGMVEASTLTELSYSGENNPGGTQLSVGDTQAAAAASKEEQNQSDALAAGNAQSGEAIENSGDADNRSSGQPGEGNEEGTEAAGQGGEGGSMVVEGEPDDGGAAEEADGTPGETGSETQNNGTAPAGDASAQTDTSDGEGSENSSGNTDSMSGNTAASAQADDADTAGNSAGGGAGSTGQSSASGGDAPVTGSIVVTIPDGVGSEEICELLQSAGVIDSASAFNNFLVQSGRDCYIGTGARLIPRGATYEEVGEIIAGR